MWRVGARLPDADAYGPRRTHADAPRAVAGAPAYCSLLAPRLVELSSWARSIVDRASYAYGAMRVLVRARPAVCGRYYLCGALYALLCMCSTTRHMFVLYI